MNKIILYGAGITGKKYYKFLKTQNLENTIYCFCDKNSKKIRNIDEVPVYSYDEVKNKGYAFIVSMYDSKEVCMQLRKEQQKYYCNIEDWIKDNWEDKAEQIKMLINYRNMDYKKNKGAVLDNIGSDLKHKIDDLGLDRAVRIYGGVCPCCNEKTLFVSYDYWLRDNYQCLFCESIPRNRALVKVLNEEVPDWREKKMHESSPGGITFQMFRQQCEQYSYSYWYDTKEPGESLGDQVSNQNLENLSFEDETFDIFITQDVLEHVNYPEKVFAEISRTLKKGGIHIFTVPVFPFRKTRSRIKMDNDKRTCILPPIYHGDPINEQGTLLTYEWGHDIIEFIKENSNMETKVIEFPNSKENLESGLEGDFLQVFVSRKV